MATTRDAPFFETAATMPGRSRSSTYFFIAQYKCSSPSGENSMTASLNFSCCHHATTYERRGVDGDSDVMLERRTDHSKGYCARGGAMPIGAPVDSSLLFAVGSLGGRCARVGLGARTRAARPEGAYRVQRVRGGQQDQQNGGSRHNELEREPWAGHAAPPSLLLYLLLLGCPVA